MRCRACKALLADENLIKFENMPKSAQFFPEDDNLMQETGVDIVIKECRYCGLIQTIGEPVSYYRDVIRATKVSAEMREFRRKQYQMWVDEYRLVGKTVLEVGCGCGEYMDMMEETGAIVYGLEHKEESVQRASIDGHKIIQGFIENEDFIMAEGPFAAFYSMNFLEHIPRPGDFLRGICANLEDDAIGIVEVPNFNMMLDKSLYSEFIQDHLSYFTESSLRNLLENNGFEVIKCESIWYDYIISAVVRKREKNDLKGMIIRHKQLRDEVSEFLLQERNKGHHIATWGAGHQALANLSLLEMAESIDYVIDSADFKQGKYTPATHLPIVAPERLNEKNIDTVIIMAGGYSEEIKGIISNKYPWVTSYILGEDGITK